MTSPYDTAVAFLCALDQDWNRAIKRIGPCLHSAKECRTPFQALVRAVAYQQISTKVGDAILGRLVARFPETAFPTPEDLCTADIETLRACGFSARKSATLQCLGQQALEGLIPSREDALSMNDEELIKRITTIKGIGRWTVEMMMIYTLDRLDILPVDDFGIREGYRRLKGLEAQPTAKTLYTIGLAWSPHRTIASWYLWRIAGEMS